MNNKKIQVIYKDVDELIPYINNPRLNDDAVDAVASSIKNFGFKNPIVIDSDNEIINGHTRLKAAKKLGLDTVPVIVADDLTEAQKKAFRLADNKVSEIAEWDIDKLNIEIEELENLDINLECFGFEDELNSFKDLEVEVVEAEEQDVLEEVYPKNEVVEEAFKYYRKTGFPYIDLEIFECKQQINKLRNVSFEKLATTNVGYQVADSYNKHRFSCSALNMKSPEEAFKNDTDLKKAIDKEYPNIKKNSIPFLSLVNGTQSCSNFRPGFCKYLLDKYGKDFDIFLDPCMGFGGRFVGFLASDYDMYISTDPSTESYKSNIKMKDDLITKSKNALMYNECFEDLDLSEYKGKCDIAFTSPPYFCKEIYSNEETQSMKKFTDYEKWKNCFLKILIQKCYDSLKNERYFILNIEDINIKNERFNLVNDSVELSKKIGFDFVEREEFVMQTRTKLVDGEKVKSEGKESVLIFYKS